MKSKKTNVKKNKSNNPAIVSMGGLDLEFTLTLTDQELEALEIQLDSINSFSDCRVFFDHKAVHDRISITAANSMITSLLYFNKCFKKKLFVEYLTLNPIYLAEEDVYFRDVIKYVTENNLIFLNETRVSNSPAKLKFVVKVGEHNPLSFDIPTPNHQSIPANPPTGEDVEDVHDEEVVEDNNDHNNNINDNHSSAKHKSVKEGTNKTNNNIENVNQEVNKKDVSRHGGSHQGSNKEHTHVMNEDIRGGSHHGSNKEQSHIKTEANNEHVKTESKQEQEQNFFSETIDCDYKAFNYLLLDLETILPITNELGRFKDFVEYLTYITKRYKKLEVLVNYPHITANSKLMNLEVIDSINTVLALSDLCIFEKKEALALFNMLHQINSDEEQPEDLTKGGEKYLDVIFLNAYKKTRQSFNKKAVFVEDLNRLTVIDAKPDNSGLLYNSRYDFQLHPKINHTNQKLVDEYKKHLALNYNKLKSVFIGCFLHKYVIKEPYFTGFLAGEQVTRRILEIEKNSWKMPEEKDFYYVIIDKSLVEEQMKKEVLQKKEEKFVLDCVNVNNSRLRSYNPLFDNHLLYFFSSDMVKKNLKESGFINTNGFILPVERKSPERSNKIHQYEEKVINTVREKSIEKKKARSPERSMVTIDSKRKLPNILIGKRTSYNETEKNVKLGGK